MAMPVAFSFGIYGTGERKRQRHYSLIPLTDCRLLLALLAVLLHGPNESSDWAQTEAGCGGHDWQVLEQSNRGWLKTPGEYIVPAY